MKTEKIILSFIAVLIGLLATGFAFFIYQGTKTIPSDKIKTIVVKNPSPIPASSVFLVIDNPIDESVVDKKVISISGKTTQNATIIISTNAVDEVIEPSSSGVFTTTATIQDGANSIEITAIAPNGEEIKAVRTVTFSTESF